MLVLSSDRSRAAAGPDQTRRNRAGDLARLFVVIAALCIVATPLRATERETKVLILNGIDPTLPAFLLMDTAMRDTLARTPTQRFQFFSEALNSQRFVFRRITSRSFWPLLRKKYKGVSFDVVVPVSEPAFDFVRRHRSEFWPNAWVFFHSVPPRVIEGIEPQPRTAGIITYRTLRKTLDLARKLQPNAPRVLFIGRSSRVRERRRGLGARCFGRVAGFDGDEYALGVPLPELIELIKRAAAGRNCPLL